MSFKILDVEKSNTISVENFMKFTQECWTCGFRIVSMMIQSANQLPPEVSATSVEDWSKARISDLNQHANLLFASFDADRNGVRCFYFLVLGLSAV